MNNQKFTILTLVLIASVIASPFVYAVVEPHIKITMDASQTTKPLQIVNNLDQEVFSVDVDGTVFPSQGGSFGTEIVVLDKSSSTGSSNLIGSTAVAGYPFTMPTSANLWKITAVEVKIGTGGGVSFTDPCVAVFSGASVLTTFPPASNDFSQGVYVAYGTLGFDVNGNQGWVHNTVYKIPTQSLLIEGGEDLAVGFKGCQNNSLEFDGAIGTDPVRAYLGNVMDGSDHALGRIAELEGSNPTNQFYVKVYAKPLV